MEHDVPNIQGKKKKEIGKKTGFILELNLNLLPFK